jgi:hypothetical protein
MSEIRVDVIKDELGTGAPSFPNGNLGIGKSNPAGRLHIDTASTTNRALVVESSTGWGNIFTPMIEMSTNSDGKVFKATAATNRSDMNMFEIANANGNVLAIRGTGAVTMPYQPMICRRIATVTDVAANQLIAWDTQMSGTGISYNTSSRRFTVPITGRYRISFSGFKANTASTCRVLLGVNTDSPSSSSNSGHIYTNGSTYDSLSFDVILNLSTNDYFTFRLTEGTLYTRTSDQFNFMAAHLVG